MRKFLGLIEEKERLEGALLFLAESRQMLKENYKSVENNLINDRDAKIAEASGLEAKAHIVSVFSSHQYNLILQFLEKNDKYERETQEIIGKLKAVESQIRERGKKLSKKLYISHGMMAEALSRYSEASGDEKSWKVIKAYPCLYNENKNCFQNRFGTYLVSDDSTAYNSDYVYSVDDLENDFPNAITVGYGCGSQEAVHSAQTMLDKINWFDIYLQDLVGGIDIPHNLAVFKHADDPEWEVIREAFRNEIITNSKLELSEEDENF